MSIIMKFLPLTLLALMESIHQGTCFTISTSHSSLLPTSISTATKNINGMSTVLYGRKKGKLTQNVGTTRTETKKKKKKGNAGDDNTVSKVSSSLSQWASTQDFTTSTDTSTSNVAPTTEISSSSSSSTFTPFNNDDDKNIISNNSNNIRKTSNGKISRRERSMEREAQESKQNERIQSILSSIQDFITSNNLDISALLKLIQDLVSSGSSSSSLKKLLNGKLTYNYNLAWVGSDDAICHLGTGLHKVPLARLQDVFLSFGGGNEFVPSAFGGGNTMNSSKNSVTVMEVIRILGPFPNVRNTLLGRITNISKIATNNADNEYNSVKIVYDSMMDGLGKEIKAGNDDNAKIVDLNIIYADENALVCIVPPKSDDDDGNDSDSLAFGDMGQNVLLFLKEEDLDGKLDGLRAS